mgnify:FL=1
MINNPENKYLELGKDYFTDEYYNEYFGGNYLEETKDYSCPTASDIKYLMEWVGEDFKSAIDFGCALGTLVKELNDDGINCIGLEVSEYAVKNAVSEKVYRDTYENITSYIELPVDLIIASYSIEHFSYKDLEEFLKWSSKNCRYMFVSVYYYNLINKDDEVFEVIPIKEGCRWWINKLSEYFDVLFTDKMIVCKSTYLK